MKLRIGTRNSPLALWQAREVARLLEMNGVETEILPIVSTGDKNLTQPLYEMGITGVFTRDLDVSLLDNQIDIAVHSLKDVPTKLPKNIEIFACLKRDSHEDVLVRNPASQDKPLSELSVATGSLRRRAFWLKEMPATQFFDIRGNVQTRLKKIEEGLADATIFSLAGLQRLDLGIKYEKLPFILSAPAQGVVAIAGRADNQEISSFLKKINDPETFACVKAERDFLSILEGGCTAPIGAFAEIIGGRMRFLGKICTLDGAKCIEVDEVFDINDEKIGQTAAEKIMKNGAKEIMDEIRNQLP